tara:strand:- start:318 stop:557 length:240 start_codon:yes stop_codon:yes gene_type:complete
MLKTSAESKISVVFKIIRIVFDAKKTLFIRQPLWHHKSGLKHSYCVMKSKKVFVYWVFKGNLLYKSTKPKHESYSKNND